MLNPKNRLIISMAIFAILVAFGIGMPTAEAAGACTGAVHTVTIFTDPDDSYVNQYDPAVNYGADSYMVVGRHFGRKASGMHFNGITMPVGACVSKAKLKVHVADELGTTPQGVNACRIAGVWNGFAVTWATRPAIVPVCSPPVGMTLGWNTFDVANIVQEWANGIPNDGISLRALGVLSYLYYINAFDSGVNIPRLTVTYQDP